MTRPRVIGRAELALAYELRQEGVRWKLICRALGIGEDRLRRLFRSCERDGIEQGMKTR